jgi:glycogen operon protein
MSDEWERQEGATSPLGASWIEQEQSYNFALYSKHAEEVTLLLYDDGDFATPLRAIPFAFPFNKTNRIWHMRVPAATAGDARYYAYRVAGPFAPEQGQRFDAQKILLDPYAVGVFFPPGFSRHAARRPGSNAGAAPLGLLPPRSPADPAPQAPGPRYAHDLIIYEMHVRGFTRHDNSGVAPAERGTFAGVVAKIPHLKLLGVTAVELLPVQQFDPQEGNYWGYMTLNFFSPHTGYAEDGSPEGAMRAFRWMVEKLHEAGIEVYLDVVYNHSAEAGAEGPTYSFRGIDNSTYYALDRADLNRYADNSGCGNDLRTAHPVVRRLVIDSLRFWAREMGVDGFRFDLASIFTLNDDGSINQDDPPLISEITTNPDLASVRLIAEPWEGKPGTGYMMGRVFPGKTWRQWNDRFRDTVRDFVKGEPGLAAALATRLYGSTDLLPDSRIEAFRRYQSVNYIDSHDGLNLYDLVSYTKPDEHSWDCGFEGSLGTPPEVMALRRRQVKNFCCLLMLSNGTPMFAAGDEFMHTRMGNANPWDQDNEISWLDWSLAEANADILRFFRMMIAFRKAHPTIGRSTGWRDDVTWHGLDGAGAFGAHGLAFHLKGQGGSDGDLYVMINGFWQDRLFPLLPGSLWLRVVDTSLESPADIVERADASGATGTEHLVRARSIVVLTR